MQATDRIIAKLAANAAIDVMTILAEKANISVDVVGTAFAYRLFELTQNEDKEFRDQVQAFLNELRDEAKAEVDGLAISTFSRENEADPVTYAKPEWD